MSAIAKAYRVDVGATGPDPEQTGPELPADNPPPRPREPRMIVAAPPIAPMHPGEAALWDVDLKDVISTAIRRAERRPARRRWHLPRPGLSAAIVMLLALNAALIAWRADVVRVVPQTASLYATIGLPVNLRGLVFSNVTTETKTDDGVAVLVVEGTIASAAARVVDVPTLRFSVRNDGGHEIYTWTTPPSESVLAPGATLAFRSRLASPPREGSEVLVRFFNQRDRGMH